MRVLVTGHEDTSAASSCRYSGEAGHEVVGLDAATSRTACSGRRRTRSRRCASTSATSAVPRSTGSDAVMHLAALCNDPLGNLNPDLTYDVNHRATVRLAEAAKAAGVHAVPLLLVVQPLRRGRRRRPAGRDGRLRPDHARTASRRSCPSGPRRSSPTTTSRPCSCATPPPTASRPGCAATSSSTTWPPTPCSPARCGCCPTARRGGPLVHAEDIAAAFLALLEVARASGCTPRPTTSARRARTTSSATSPSWCTEVVPARVTFAEGAGTDARNYRVTCDLIAAEVPEFRPQWTVQARHRAAGRAVPAVRPHDRAVRQRDPPAVQADQGADGRRPARRRPALGDGMTHRPRLRRRAARSGSSRSPTSATSRSSAGCTGRRTATPPRPRSGRMELAHCPRAPTCATSRSTRTCWSTTRRWTPTCTSPPRSSGSPRTWCRASRAVRPERQARARHRLRPGRVPARAVPRQRRDRRRLRRDVRRARPGTRPARPPSTAGSPRAMTGLPEYDFFTSRHWFEHLDDPHEFLVDLREQADGPRGLRLRRGPGRGATTSPPPAGRSSTRTCPTSTRIPWRASSAGPAGRSSRPARCSRGCSATSRSRPTGPAPAVTSAHTGDCRRCGPGTSSSRRSPASRRGTTPSGSAGGARSTKLNADGARPVLWGAGSRGVQFLTLADRELGLPASSTSTRASGAGTCRSPGTGWTPRRR